MRNALWIALGCVALAHPVAAQVGTPLPSGREAERIETLSDLLPDGTTVLRLRYVVEGLSEGDFATVEADFSTLCEAEGLPIAQAMDPAPTRAIISLASAPLAFGETRPDVTQFFEIFSFTPEGCVWEAF